MIPAWIQYTSNICLILSETFLCKYRQPQRPDHPPLLQTHPGFQGCFLLHFEIQQIEKYQKHFEIESDSGL
ncbi:unnamed protein product [Moneuplotes crassus]|uniref:Uncharacterized protein n=1 Tax=Euplotes crassus TaxID=5936 RepID=A0AAD2D080_EUPCR|nr:unnamed protein product [Moneuplotes crassus]